MTRKGITNYLMDLLSGLKPEEAAELVQEVKTIETFDWTGGSYEVANRLCGAQIRYGEKLSRIIEVEAWADLDAKRNPGFKEMSTGTIYIFPSSYGPLCTFVTACETYPSSLVVLRELRYNDERITATGIVDHLGLTREDSGRSFYSNGRTIIPTEKEVAEIVKGNLVPPKSANRPAHVRIWRITPKALENVFKKSHF